MTVTNTPVNDNQNSTEALVYSLEQPDFGGNNIMIF